MWLSPHILVLDEPTNYLDRDSLGALATAIKEYGGGVVMISHNSGARLANMQTLTLDIDPRPMLSHHSGPEPNCAGWPACSL